MLVQNLVRGGFPGSIFPVNRNYSQIHGLTAHAAITALPAPADLAIIAIPIKDVPEIIKKCGQAGIRAAIIVSAGGREIGPQGKVIEDAIQEEAVKAGVRYLGPNSMGLLCPPARLNASVASICLRREAWRLSPKAGPCAGPSWAGPLRRTSASATLSALAP